MAPRYRAHEVWPELAERGLYRSHDPSQLLDDDDAESLLNELLSELATGSSIARPPGRRDHVLLDEKLPDLITHTLTKRGLLNEVPDGFSAHDHRVLPMLLAILATRVAHRLEGDGHGWTAATDSEQSVVSGTGIGREGAAREALLLAVPSLPRPRIQSDRDLLKIADFAVANRATLDRWHTQLDSLLQANLDDASCASDALDTYVDNIEELVDTVRADMLQYNLSPVATSLVTVAAPAAASSVLAGNPFSAISGTARVAGKSWRRLRVRVVRRRWRRTQPGRAFLLDAAAHGLLRIPRR